MLLRVAVCCFLGLVMHSKALKPQEDQDLMQLQEETINSLQYIQKPYMLIAFICWNKEGIVRLSRNIFERIHVEITVLSSVVDFPISSSDAHHTVFLLDVACHNADLFIDWADSRLMFNAPYRWVVIDSPARFIDLQSPLENCSEDPKNSVTEVSIGALTKKEEFPVPYLLWKLNLLTDSDVTVLHHDETLNSWTQYKVYRRGARGKEHSEWETEDVQGKTGEHGQLPIAIRRQDLHGAPLSVCYVLTNNDTIYHLQDYRNKEIDTITKVNYVLTGHVIELMNASRRSSFQSSWGYRLAGDGNTSGWSGMIGELTAGRADIGGSPLFLTADRVPVVDYVAMPSATRSKFVFRQPKLSYMSNVFLLPFRAPVWAGTGALLLLLAVALLIASRAENGYQRSSSSHSPSVTDVILLALGAMCQQGTDVQLKGFVGRTISHLLFLSLMFLYTSYSGNIVALLQSSSTRIHTLSDLLHSRLKFAVHDTVFNRYYFSTASEPVRKAIYTKKVAPPGETAKFISLEEGVRKLRKGLFAFHMEIGVGYKLVEEMFQENEKCGLQEIQYLQVVDPWLAVQKNSSFKEMISIGFRRLQESGLQHRENWRLYTRKPRCAAGSGSLFVSVGLVDSGPAFRLLAVGQALAALVMIAEAVYHKFFGSRQQLRSVGQLPSQN